MENRLAIVPILWNNDDIPDLSHPETPYGEILAACEKLGFAGVEMGTNFPNDGNVLAAALKARHLALAAARFGPDWLDRSKLRENLASGSRLGTLVDRVGASVLVLPEVLRPERALVAGTATREHRANPDDFARLVENIQELATLVSPFGVTCAFHNHAGSYVETEEEIEQFLESTDKTLVKFCLDTGHATVGGADPVALAKRHAERIAHVHLKDVDPTVLENLRRERFGFLEGVKSHLFCELGRGCARIAETVAVLRESGYDGWWVAEQDTTQLGPFESARVSHDFLASLLAMSH